MKDSIPAAMNLKQLTRRMELFHPLLRRFENTMFQPLLKEAVNLS